MLDLMIEDETS